MRRTTPLGWLVLAAALVMLAAPSPASARAWLGVYTQEVSSELREALELSGEGALVTSVVPDSPADRAGLRKGDVIVSVDRHEIASPSDLSERIGEAREGESVSLTVVRERERLSLEVRLGERPQDDEEFSAPTPPTPPTPRVAPTPRTPAVPKAPRVEPRWDWSDEPDKDRIRERARELVREFDVDGLPGPGRMTWIGLGRGRLGVRVESLNDDLASALGASGARGALVVEVLKDTPAEKAGIRAGDIITAVDGTAVYDADDLVKALRNEDGRVPVSIVRRGEKRTVEAALERSPRAMRLREGREPLGMGRMEDDGKVEIRVKGDADDEDLRKELEELREQLRELRRELQERRR